MKSIVKQKKFSKKENKNYKKFSIDKGSLIGLVMMNKFSENDSISFNFEHKNKTPNMNSFVVFEVTPQILEMLNSVLVKRSNLTNLLLDSSKKRNIFSFELIENIVNQSGINIHALHQSLNSFKVFGLILPDFKSLDTFSTDSITSLTIDSLTSLKSSSEISDISLIFFNSCSFFKSSNVSVNALLAIDDQLIKSVSSILDFNSSGTDNVIVPILNLQCNYLYYLYTKDIFKPFVPKKHE